MPEHVDIDDPNIHEPKGISLAAQGEIYIADGTGSGSWQNPTESTASYFEGVSTHLAQTTASVPTPDVEVGIAEGFTTSGGVVTCTTVEARKYLVSCTLDATLSPDPDSEPEPLGSYNFFLAKNGVAVNSSITSERIIMAVIELQQNDQLTVRAAGIGNVHGVTINRIAYSIFGN